MTSKVFLSYANDDRALAESAKGELEKQGHVPMDSVFIDFQDVPSGVDIRQTIRSRIEASDAVVVVLTEAAESSQWINYEVGLADALGKPIFVVSDKDPKDQQLLANLSSYQSLKLAGAK